MRAAIVFAMSLIAAFVPPMRQACASTCVQPAAGHIAMEAETPPCHKTSATPETETPPAPVDDRCSHDHSAALKQSDAPLVIGNPQSVICNLTAVYRLPIADSRAARVTPPPLSLPLRI